MSMPILTQRGHVALVAAILTVQAGAGAQEVTQPALRAAFLYNFAKFAEWPTDPTPRAPLNLCVLDDRAVESALDELVGGSAINGRAAVVPPRGAAVPLRACHLLYVSGATGERTRATLDALHGAPVLTVGDGGQFVVRGGMIGLFVEDGRMRFAINPNAARRAGIHLSSRLLTLATILEGHSQ